jgi:hypothetical protein
MYHLRNPGTSGSEERIMTTDSPTPTKVYTINLAFTVPETILDHLHDSTTNRPPRGVEHARDLRP